MPELVRLVGIARMAAEGSLLAEKQRVEYRTLPTRNWLNRCDSRRVPFHWTINPYRGCEYGCKYCYARFTHEFLEKSEVDAFEREIYVKDLAEGQLEQELCRVKPGQVIGLGTATDPYQPLERKFERTRKVLEALRTVAGISLFITTKSDLVTRDAELLREIGKRNQVRVTCTITTLDGKLAKLTEPYAPRPDLRIACVEKLTAAGVAAGVIASPVLPWITDSPENLESIARAAKDAGADQFGANVLFLQPAAKRSYYPFIERKFPELAERYTRAYGAGAYLRDGYPEVIRARVAAIRQRVGIAERDFAHSAAPPVPHGQMLLF